MIESYKNPINNIINPNNLEEDLNTEISIRPASLDQFVGQKEITDNLKVYIKAAKQRNEALDHVLFFGPPGLGKTTLANIVSKELNVNISSTSGPVLERAGDLAGMLTNLENKDVFFIDEIHRVSSIVEEYLYSAMEDYIIDIMLDKGPSARSVQLNLNPFTLVGATTRLGNLTSPLRDRFGVILRFDFYNDHDLGKIIKRSSKILNISINEKGVSEISRRSRGTPRIANRILRRARDFAQVNSKKTIDEEVAKEALRKMGIDEMGLDEMDRQILNSIIDNYNGGPVGIETLGVAISEDAKTLEEVYEPFLIKEGFIQRTPRGRIALEKTYKYLDKESKNNNQQKLL